MPSFLKLRLISNTFSSPPTTRRLRYSSGAILRYRSMSSALWCVLKGRAAAPPGIGCIIGVSTSRKPRATKNSRIACTSLERLGAGDVVVDVDLDLTAHVLQGRERCLAHDTLQQHAPRDARRGLLGFERFLRFLPMRAMQLGGEILAAEIVRERRAPLAQA